MNDLLLVVDRVRNTIALGESHFREFKSAWEGPAERRKARNAAAICRDIAEALVAFANADGGDLIIGVEDDGTISGVPHNDPDCHLMMNSPSTHTHQGTNLPITAAEQVVIEDKKILFFAVAKGTSEIYQLADGRCVCRRDKATIPESLKAIEFGRQEIKSREYDRHFVDGITVNDLDIDHIQALANNYLRGLSVERYLQQLGLAEYATGGLRLRMAAVLLFAKDIQRYHPRCQVRVLRIAGTELQYGEAYNVKSDEHAQGNLLELLVSSWEKVRPYLAYKTEFGTDARFIQKYLYPEGACREALVNAIAHRDYSIQSGIDVFIYDNRIEIKSPGAMLSTISIDDLQSLSGAHESRNSFIARTLRENQFMRELGEGMKRMFKLMEESELEPPTLINDPTSFTVLLKNRSIFSDRQERWLELYSQFELSSLQKRIVVLGAEEKLISPADIYKAMNTNDRDTYDRQVTHLRQKGILIQIRTNAEANKIAKTQHLKKSSIARFKVSLPPDVANNDISRGVFVANLPFDIEKNELQGLFQLCGKIQRIDLPHKDGQPKGFGFIWFDSSESAKRAIKEYDRYDFRGRPIKVDKIRPSTRE